MNSRTLLRARVREFLIGSLIAGCLAGCASMPETGQASNGQPLRIVDRKIDDSRYEDVEVGKSDHYNSNGDYTGTSVQTQTQFVRDSHMEYELRQGTAPIDAQDFMRIAGDIEGAGKLESDRKQGVRLNHAGFPLAGAGLALAAIAAQSMGKGPGKGSYYLYSGGAGLMAGGYLMIHFGGVKARPLKVLTGRSADDMRILRRLDEDLSHPPAPAASVPGSLPPAAPPAASMAPPEIPAPAADAVSRYATGSLPIAALRLVDASGQTLIESHADGTLWAGVPLAKVGEIRGGAITWPMERNASALGRDGSYYVFRGAQAAERVGKLDPAAGLFRGKDGDYVQVLKDGTIKSVEKGKGQMLQSHFTTPVQPRARALAAVLAVEYAKT
jgi:hypothetical protein